MLSARFGHILDEPFGRLAGRIPFSPNFVTIMGFLITAAAAALIPLSLPVGGLLILIGGAFDMLDGVIARTQKKSTKFGAFLDSTLDRYSDSLLFISAAWTFLRAGEMSGVFYAVGGLVGALLTSYVRARAEGLGIPCHVGILERPERIVILALGCLTGLLYPAVIVLFFLGHITVAQRIRYVYRRGM
ncbi:MAG: CDP-alcohol phosphatidyltransferase family protein [Nitrospirales bacterium]|nr:CDP-alcohol phosphatidyltransferase family protein [Nitrospirales bacterium]